MDHFSCHDLLFLQYTKHQLLMCLNFLNNQEEMLVKSPKKALKHSSSH